MLCTPLSRKDGAGPGSRREAASQSDFDGSQRSLGPSPHARENIVIFAQSQRADNQTPAVRPSQTALLQRNCRRMQRQRHSRPRAELHGGRRSAAFSGSGDEFSEVRLPRSLGVDRGGRSPLRTGSRSAGASVHQPECTRQPHRQRRHVGNRQQRGKHGDEKWDHGPGDLGNCRPAHAAPHEQARPHRGRA